MSTMPRYPVMGKVVLPTGEGMPLDKSIPAENFYSALKYQPDTDDIFVVTYPKNGTTWMVGLLSRALDGLVYFIYAFIWF